MTGWLLLAIAIIANAATNVFLRRLAAAIDLSAGLAVLTSGLGSIWFWAAGVSGFALVASYLMALRQLELAGAYAVVTSGALMLLSIYSAFVLGAGFPPMKVLGLLLIVGGIALVSLS